MFALLFPNAADTVNILPSPLDGKLLGFFVVCLFLFFKLNLFIFIYLFLAALGLRCCARTFSNCSKQGLPFVAVRRFLIAVASLVAEHGL